MIMLVIMVVGTVAILVSTLNSSALQIARDKTTADALAKAKDALVGYAASNATRPGELPCPDLNNDGVQDACASPNLVGWLPWKTLGLPELRDANGDHLWYAVSDAFRPGSTAALTSDTPSAYPASVLSLKDGVSGTQIENNVVAIVFSPGTPLGQTRSLNDNNASASLPNYLEGDNANLDMTFQTANDKVIPLPTPAVNDRPLTIGKDSLLLVVETRIARDAKKCLDDYAALSAGKYPWAAPVSDATYTSTSGTYFGRIPAAPSTSGGPLTPTISALLAAQSQLSSVQTALNAYAANPNATNTSNLLNAALTLISMKSNPLFTSTVSNAVDNAGDGARNLANGAGSTVSSVNNVIASANSVINTALNNAGYTSGDPAMASSWAAVPSCNALFTAPYWVNWQSEVFYQVANGFQPNSTASCGSCLSITGSGNPAAGSGTYRAAVAVARQPLAGQWPRNFSSDASYLEGINRHATAPSTAFVAYSPSDTANYANVNDLVLCLDGRMNCQ